MASRRMFSKAIIDSARFIKMPSSARLLYYDLGMRADDDGVVEAFTVVRSSGASEDDLKILSAKGFIRVLNDDLVSFITDWTEHNNIRADRKIDTLYKNLLLEVIPDVEIKPKKQRSDTKKTEIIDCSLILDGPRTDNGQLRIGKDRIGKDSVVNTDASNEAKKTSSSKREKKKTYYGFELCPLTDEQFDEIWERSGRICHGDAEMTFYRALRVVNEWYQKKGKTLKSGIRPYSTLKQDWVWERATQRISNDMMAFYADEVKRGRE